MSIELRTQFGVPPDAACFFKDGNAWCCVRGDFINIQESPAGFGDTMDEALTMLHAEVTGKPSLTETEQHILHGGWRCNYCGYDGQDNQRYNMFCYKCRVHR